MFRIDHDPAANLLTIRVEGFWRPEDVPGFAKVVGARANAARAHRSDFQVIVESLDFPVQGSEVADLMPNIMRGLVTLTSGHGAVVVGSHLNRMQAERTLVHPRVKVFMTMDEARQWLAGVLSGEPVTA